MTVAIWRLALDLRPAELDRLRRTLDSAERTRAAQFRRDVDADRFVARRGLLRHVLGRLVGLEPAAVKIGYGRFGKPLLASEPRLRFNLAQSGGLGLLAVADGADVGVDLEALVPQADSLRIARAFFCAGELRELATLPDAERDAAFLRCWTRKEAYVKAIGDGLSVPLDDFAVSLLPGRPARLVWTRSREEMSRWAFEDVSNIAPETIAAICVAGAAVRVRASRSLP